jgi:hypothetical protein
MMIANCQGFENEREMKNVYVVYKSEGLKWMKNKLNIMR